MPRFDVFQGHAQRARQREAFALDLRVVPQVDDEGESARPRIFRLHGLADVDVPAQAIRIVVVGLARDRAGAPLGPFKVSIGISKSLPVTNPSSSIAPPATPPRTLANKSPGSSLLRDWLEMTSCPAMMLLTVDP